MALAQREDLRLLIHDVNNAAGKSPRKRWTGSWTPRGQELEDGIDAAIDGAATAQATSKGEPDDMLVEVVETVRRIERYMDGDMKRASLASDSLGDPVVATNGRPLSELSGKLNSFSRSSFSIETAARRDDLDHGTNAAYVRRCLQRLPGAISGNGGRRAVTS
jgi:hypothetical protein